MSIWKARLLALLTMVAMVLAVQAAPALADNNCHWNDRQNEWVNCGSNHGFHHDFDRHFDDVEVFFVPIGFWNFNPFLGWFWDNGCGFDWDGPVTPLDCFD